MPGGRRGGERRPHALSKTHASDARRRSSRADRDPSFARSSDPRVRRSLLYSAGEEPGGSATASVSRSGKPASAGGTGTGADVAGRGAARRASPLPSGEVVRDASNRKEVTASVLARIASSGFVPVRRCSCRSRQATSGPKYARHTRRKNGGQGRVNGGLARSTRRRVRPVGGRAARSDARDPSPRRTLRPGATKTQGGVTAPSSGRRVAVRRPGGRGAGALGPPDPTKGPCRWKASRVAQKLRLSRGVSGARPRRSAHPPILASSPKP